MQDALNSLKPLQRQDTRKIFKREGSGEFLEVSLMYSCAFFFFSLFFFNSLEENIIPALEKIPENTGSKLD